MAEPVNLLLLLSALLSALTGGGAAVRAPVAAHAAASAAAVVQADVRAARVAHRPQQALPALVAVQGVAAGAAVLVLIAIQPLYASRRRE
ncbi:MAG: hypothetical protein PGN08_04060 [Sphingomonas taxi]